jgi:uncharacterized protein involved in response to NO
MPPAGLWRAFVWGAFLAALGPGFLAGALLSAVLGLGVPLGPWWPAMAQVHGHAQLAGFAGLMVLGVAFHFLPRLRGAPLAAPGAVPWVLALYGGGLLLRVLGQTLGPLVPPAAPVAPALRLLFVLSGPLTLGGALAGLVVLGRTALRGPALRTRAGFHQVAPLLAAGGTAFLLFHGLNALGTLTAGGAAPWLVPPALDAAAVRLALLGWLVPVAVAFSARSFPLFLWTRPPRRWVLQGGLALLLLGLALSLSGVVAGGLSPGLLLEGLALLGFVHALNILAPRVTPPGRQRDLDEARLARATRWPLVGAYGWLVVAGLLLLLQALLPLAGAPPPPEDAVRHALGTGYVLLLIVGMGLRLLPGFAGRRARDVRFGWALTAIGAALAAAFLRVLPPLLVWLGVGGPPATLTLALAGGAGALAVLALGAALRPALRPA